MTRNQPTVSKIDWIAELERQIREARSTVAEIRTAIKLGGGYSGPETKAQRNTLRGWMDHIAYLQGELNEAMAS